MEGLSFSFIAGVLVTVFFLVLFAFSGLVKRCTGSQSTVNERSYLYHLNIFSVIKKIIKKHQCNKNSQW